MNIVGYRENPTQRDLTAKLLKNKKLKFTFYTFNVISNIQQYNMLIQSLLQFNPAFPYIVYVFTKLCALLYYPNNLHNII